MCGLYGCITKSRLNPNQYAIRHNIIRGLALYMQERGTHSTGLAGVKSNKTQIIKKALTAKEFIFRKEYKKFMRNNYDIIIGHTRSATVGDKTDKNAHPFRKGSIIGAHNGRVTNWQEVYQEGEVDSEAIFHLLDKSENNFEQAFSELAGTFAVTWLTQDNPTQIHLMVNGNPLFLIKIEELDSYFWCSTSIALQSIIGSYFNIQNRISWSPKTDIVYTINNQFEIHRRDIALKITQPAPAVPINTHQTLNLPEYSEATEDNFNLDQYRTLMNLSYRELQQIMQAFLGSGCMFCGEPIMIKDGFYWSTINKQILCYKCNAVIGDNENLIFIDKTALEGIKADIAAYNCNDDC